MPVARRSGGRTGHVRAIEDARDVVSRGCQRSQDVRGHGGALARPHSVEHARRFSCTSSTVFQLADLQGAGGFTGHYSQCPTDEVAASSGHPAHRARQCAQRGLIARAGRSRRRRRTRMPHTPGVPRPLRLRASRSPTAASFSGTGFRLDLPSADADESAVAERLVRSPRHRAVDDVELRGLRIVEEPHRARGARAAVTVHAPDRRPQLIPIIRAGLARVHPGCPRR